METVYDWITVAIFGGLVVLYVIQVLKPFGLGFKFPKR